MSSSSSSPPDVYGECAADTAGSSELLLQCVANRLSQEYQSQSASIEANLQYSRELYLVISAALVFFMQAGFAMVCAGSVRRKNLQNTMLKNLLDACGASVAFWSVGYAFAFGTTSGGLRVLFGTTNFFLMNIDDNFAFWVFQYAFSAAAATIVAGTLSERCQMNAYFYYSVFLSGWVYPVVVHVVWSEDGFLSTASSKPLLGIGVVDVAGSGVVHLTGGFSALIAAWVLGPRRGRFHDEVTGELLEKPRKIVGHSVSLQMVGTLILWFCWYGFNSGSVLLLGSDHEAMLAALAATNTTLAAGAAGITALVVNMIAQDIIEGEAHYDLNPAMNGVLSGLVAITAGCSVVEPWAAVIIGVIGGLLYLFGSWYLIHHQIDDAVNAVPVHMFCGIWGMLAVGLFTSPTRLRQSYGIDDSSGGLLYGIFQGGDDIGNLFGAQIIGTLFIIGWTTLFMLPFFSILAHRGLFRSSAKDEVVGLDKSFHGGLPGAGGDAFVDANQRNIYQALINETLASGKLGDKQLTIEELQEFQNRAYEMGLTTSSAPVAATITTITATTKQGKKQQYDDDPSNSTRTSSGSGSGENGGKAGGRNVRFS